MNRVWLSDRVAGSGHAVRKASAYNCSTACTYACRALPRGWGSVLLLTQRVLAAVSVERVMHRDRTHATSRLLSAHVHRPRPATLQPGATLKHAEAEASSMPTLSSLRRLQGQSCLLTTFAARAKNAQEVCCPPGVVCSKPRPTHSPSRRRGKGHRRHAQSEVEVVLPMTYVIIAYYVPSILAFPNLPFLKLRVIVFSTAPKKYHPRAQM